MEFRKSYTLLLEDYMHYNRFSHRKQLIMMPALFLVLMLAVCIFIVFADRTPDFATLTVIVLLIVLFASLIALSNILALNHQARRQYRSSHSLKSEFELVIDKNGVRESSASGSSNARWDQVIYAVESKKAFFIHMSVLQAFVIPKALLNQNEDALIRKLLAAHLSGKKYRIRR